MSGKGLLSLIGALAVAIGGPVNASTALQSVIDDHWQWWLSVHPVDATSLGDRRYDDRIEDLSLEAADRAAAQARRFLERLRSIEDSQLSEEDRIDKSILDWGLARDVESNSFGERMMLFNSIYSWPQNFANLAHKLPFESRADYESFLTRLSKYPQLNAQAMQVTARALRQGFIQPCSTLGATAAAMSGAVDGQPEDTRFYLPFKKAKPSGVSDSEWQAMKERAVTIVRDTLTPEYRRFNNWFAREYLPKCRKDDSASSLPDGKAWYAYLAKVHTTTDLTPEQIHEIGLNEVARVTARMDTPARQAGFASRQDFIREIKSNPKYFAKSEQELLNAAAWEAKLHEAVMPRYFGVLPRLTYGLRAVPPETAEGAAFASYMEGSPAARIPGFLYTNTSKLDQRPLWELPAMIAHEGVPGHHHQFATMQELDVPKFRQYAVAFSAYTEGWGLYSEFLGEEMGFYDTPEKMIGRLSYEAWRGARLVVDTGIHAKGWNKQRAVAYLKANTGLADANIEAEVNRYISMPGQALSYKIGEIRIRELRRKAERELGENFDLRAFHDALLSKGAVPLTLMEETIDRWIASRRAKSAN